MKKLIDKLHQEQMLSAEEFRTLLTERSEETDLYARELADQVRQQVYGNQIYVRGLIEFTNYCKNDCYYCGIRRSNRNAQRYRLTEEDILACCKEGYELGFRTFVLQGGEDGYYTDEKLAEIVDFAVVDKDGKLTNTIEKGTTCTFKMKIEFHKDLQEPIVAFTIKDMKGTEITGTNTMYEKIEVPAKKDTVVEVSFTQKMDLQGGSYLISFGCTGYMEGDFHVFHRLYDACSVNVVSMKDTVGFYDMNSKIEVEVTK